MKIKHLATVAVLASALGTAQACTLDNWNGGNSGMVYAQNPTGDGNNTTGAGSVNDGGATPRWSGQCAMKADGAGHVQDNSPSAETSANTRFYFYADGSFGGTADLFKAYSNESLTGTPVISVTYDGTNVSISSGSANGTVPAATGSWHSVEIHWSNSGSIDVWVDGDPAATTPPAADFSASNASTSTLEAVAFGPMTWTGAAGTMAFDAYEMHRTTAVGTDSVLIPGDANGDGSVSLTDVLDVLSESVTGTPSSGQPDANADGSVTLTDMLCALNKSVLGPDTPCS